MTLSDLTEREREVAELVAKGLSYAAIGRQLVNLRIRGKEGVSGTVKQTVVRIASRIASDDLALCARDALDHSRAGTCRGKRIPNDTLRLGDNVKASKVPDCAALWLSQRRLD